MYYECKCEFIWITASVKCINGKLFSPKYLFLENTKIIVIFLTKHILNFCAACLKGKSYAPSFICTVVAQQHVYVRNFNYISHDSLNLRSLFCRESRITRVRVESNRAASACAVFLNNWCDTEWRATCLLGLWQTDSVTDFQGKPRGLSVWGQRGGRIGKLPQRYAQNWDH